jgi:uncharacterized protein
MSISEPGPKNWSLDIGVKGLCAIAHATSCGRPRAYAATVGRIAVRVQPRASRDEIAGERAGVLVLRVKAPPVDGRANAAACRLVAKRVGVPPSHVKVVRGESARDKLLEIEGRDEDALRRTLAPGD